MVKLIFPLLDTGQKVDKDNPAFEGMSARMDSKDLKKKAPRMTKIWASTPCRTGEAWEATCAFHLATILLEETTIISLNGKTRISSKEELEAGLNSGKISMQDYFNCCTNRARGRNRAEDHLSIITTIELPAETETEMTKAAAKRAEETAKGAERAAKAAGKAAKGAEEAANGAEGR